MSRAEAAPLLTPSCAGGSSSDGATDSEGDAESDDSAYGHDDTVPPSAATPPAAATSQDLSVHLPLIIDVANGFRHARPLKQPRLLQANAAPVPHIGVIQYVCNCAHGTRGLGCCLDEGGDLCPYIKGQYSVAMAQAKDIRDPNNLQRKRCYRHCAHELGYKWRRKLPDCVVSAIRSVWPEASGHYMGFYNA